MKKLALLGLFLLVLSLVQARILVDTYSLDYVTSSTEEGLKVCSCASKADRFRIQNVGDFDAAYRVGVRSGVKEWFGFSDVTFALQPGMRKDVSVFLNVPCDALPGRYDYTVQVASNHDGMKEIKRPFEVVHCQNLGFEVVPDSLAVKPCAAAGFQVRVKNVGLFDDRFTLSSSSEKVSFSEPSVLLRAQEERTVYGYYAVSCDATKDVEVPITLSSQNNGMSSSKTLKLRVQKPAYDWQVAGDKRTLCAEVPEKLGISIVNGQDAPLQYELNLKGLDFAQVEPATGSLDRYGQAKADVVFHPRKADVGSYDVLLGLKSSLDKEFDYKSLKVDVQDCHGFSAKFMEVTEKVCCGEKTLLLNVRNTGSDQDSFKVFSSEVKVLDSSITLRPGENGNVRVLWNAPCQDLDHSVRVTVVPVSRPELSRDVVFSTRVLSEESCHQVALADEKLVLRKGEEKLTVKVKNLGLEPALYALKLSSPFLRLPFVDLYLESGQVKEIPLRVLDVSAYAPGAYVADLVFSPKDASVQYVESLQIDLKEPSWAAFLGGAAKGAGAVLAVVLVLLVLAAVQLVALWKGRQAVRRKR